VLGTVGGGEDEDLTAFLDAIEQDQQLGDGGNLVLEHSRQSAKEVTADT
jgi:hypothetical protein